MPVSYMRKKNTTPNTDLAGRIKEFFGFKTQPCAWSQQGWNAKGSHPLRPPPEPKPPPSIASSQNGGSDESASSKAKGCEVKDKAKGRPAAGEPGPPAGLVGAGLGAWRGPKNRPSDQVEAAGGAAASLKLTATSTE